MNSVVLIGRLTKEPEVRYNNEMAICKFTLAVDRQKKGETDFINCVAFGKTAEVLEKYCNKGSQVCINGRIQTGSYMGKDGNKVYTTDVITDRLELLGKAEKKPEAKPVADDFMMVTEEGLPWN